jgi:hypothetical protein
MCFAAAQHAVPEAVVRAGMNGTDPNRSFAAWQLDVSHADEAAFRFTEVNGRLKRAAYNAVQLSRVKLSDNQTRPMQQQLKVTGFCLRFFLPVRLAWVYG